MPIEHVGVVGCGLMGSGIAQVCAQSGRPTVVVEVTRELLDNGMEKIRSFLDKGVARGKVTEEEREKTLGNLTGSLDIKDLGDCDIIIEAIIENLDEKIKLLRCLDDTVKPEAIFASNTSSLSITAMGAATQRPDRMIGLHFFNPVPIMKLVEVARSIGTSDETFDATVNFAKSLGKEPIVCKDTAGFLVNRLLVPYLVGAIRALESGLATIEDIDRAMALGCGYPMGPFTLLDFVGIDTTYYIANIMYDEFRDPVCAPPPLMKRMIIAGYYGKKSGKGFYDYSTDPPVATDLGI